MSLPFANILKEKDGYKICFEIPLKFSIELIWKALTEANELKLWFANADIDLKKGGKISLYLKKGQKYESVIKIVQLIPNKLFEWNWDDDPVQWKLIKINENETTLQLVYSKIHVNYLVDIASRFHYILELLVKKLEGNKTINSFEDPDADIQLIPLKVHYNQLLYSNYPEAVSHEPLSIQQEFNVPLTELWNALTQIDKIRHWYFPLNEFRPEKGFAFSFYGEGSNGSKYLHKCVVTRVEDLHCLQYNWVYEGIKGYTLLNFNLTGDDMKSALKLTHFGLESFPQNNNDLKKESFEEGWAYIINTSLKGYLQKSNNEI